MFERTVIVTWVMLVLGERLVEHGQLVEAVVVNMTDTPLLDGCMVPLSTSADSVRDSQKAVDQGWGNESTSWESAAPIAEADREAEKKEAGEATTSPEAAETSAREPEKEPEEEPTQTYADYLASQAKSGFPVAEIRKPDQSKWEATTSLLNKKVTQVEALF